MSKLHELHQLGQSTWLNYMRRAFIVSGELRQCINEGIQGVTANAAVFEDTITHHTDYDQAIHTAMLAGAPIRRIHEALMADDVQRAADILHPVFEASDGLDGFASLELDPALAHNSVDTVATARHVLAGVDRGNAMVEVPATLAEAEAIQALTADGINVNATHIFSVAAFERAAQAYISGLENFFEARSIWRTAPTAVASFSVGAIDSVVDPLLATKELAHLQGKTGIALARLLYARFSHIFSGPRWQKLARRGGRLMRPKWTRITPHNPAWPDTLYADALIGPDTVLTLTPATMAAFQARGTVAKTITTDVAAAQAHLDELTAAGIDLDAVVEKLQEQYLAASVARYQSLIEAVTKKLYTVTEIEASRHA